MTVCHDTQTGCLVVTGARGFLGSEVIRHLSRAALRVVGTDQFDESGGSAIEYRRSDILDPARLRDVMRGADTVIHAAGLAHVFDKRKERTAPFRRINEEGTSILARVAAEAGVRHCILISSVGVYGGCNTGAPCDEASPCRPVGPYAQSKWEAERRAIEIAETTRMRLTILRLATLYGEGDPGNIARLMRAIDRGRFVWIGKGDNRKSLLYVGDAAEACRCVAASHGSGVQVYNVSGSCCTVRALVEGLALELGKPLPRWRVPARLARGATRAAATLAGGGGAFGTLETAVRKWLSDDVYDSRTFERECNFRPSVGLAEGLRREVAWYRRVQAKERSR